MLVKTTLSNDLHSIKPKIKQNLNIALKKRVMETVKMPLKYGEKVLTLLSRFFRRIRIGVNCKSVMETLVVKKKNTTTLLARLD